MLLLPSLGTMWPPLSLAPATPPQRSLLSRNYAVTAVSSSADALGLCRGGVAAFDVVLAEVSLFRVPITPLALVYTDPLLETPGGGRGRWPRRFGALAEISAASAKRRRKRPCHYLLACILRTLSGPYLPNLTPVPVQSCMVAPDEAVGRSFVDSFEDTPVVLMAEGASTADVMRSVKLGAVDFLDKPLSLLKLKNIWQHSVRKVGGCIRGRRVLVKQRRKLTNSPAAVKKWQSGPLCKTALLGPALFWASPRLTLQSTQLSGLANPPSLPLLCSSIGPPPPSPLTHPTFFLTGPTPHSCR